MSRARSDGGSGAKGGGDAFASLRDRVTKRAQEREQSESRSKNPTADERASALGLNGPKAARAKGRAATAKPAVRRASSSKKSTAKGRKSASTAAGRKKAPARPRGPVGRAINAVARLVWRLLRGLFLGTAVAVILVVLAVASLRWIDPPMGTYMVSERLRLGGIEANWRSIDEMGLTLPRAAVAAEDARFCLHSGVDVEALREAAEDYLSGERVRGASTISQQTAKNMFLWHGRSLIRKGLELPFVGMMELFWGKERIIEVYLNIAEFDTGVFGVEAAAQHYFGRPAAALSRAQAAQLMVLLPNPKRRSPHALSPGQSRRAGSIAGGAQTIAARGDDRCFRAS